VRVYYVGPTNVDGDGKRDGRRKKRKTHATSGEDGALFFTRDEVQKHRRSRLAKLRNCHVM
jgi:hypothetical protein